ncbi:MAG: paraslipin [Nitrospiraceae bacterium]|nr:paraslipin [Nitrospiraceae bacterium]MDA8090110.1 paraslipin [Nitrospiraceae bacterium]
MVAAFLSAVKTVPQQTAFVIERLGRYHQTLNAGINLVMPFVDKVAYKHSLKETAHEIPEQICITKDNVQVAVDGVLFIQVIDPKLASYGITNYAFAITQLAQTTMRSEIGKIELDRTFEERMHINNAVVTAVDEAARAWGVKILRYEIKNITPPENVLKAMALQMQAEREKRAMVLQAEGQKQSVINVAEGEKMKQINVADGEAAAIRAVAQATADGLRKVGEAIQAGGMEAAQLRVAEELVAQFGNLAKSTNTLILPANFGDISSMLAAAMTVIKKVN